ncbi:hypothetical protein IWQ60_005203 [Tieghemiomyces parasiticus]|uniref:Glutamine amidotransferase type-2 domain-containing protein n=1 Tax=Tieghemiomyces parasiticus TaxID=78921 RepID=A0A9W8A7F0_9FUNG|nr:hypothetical protein IWQ60_005203 [Tieghemiomyces parasiticus]
MCGILLHLSREVSTPAEQAWFRELSRWNQHRGPDSENLSTEELPLASHDLDGRSVTLHYSAHATVLHLRGDRCVPQPLFSPGRQLELYWNGEVFDSLEIGSHTNDSEVIFSALQDAVCRNEDGSAVVETIRKIGGPFAFALLDKTRGALWFSRDCLGRRSLLWSSPSATKPTFTLSSVGPPSLNADTVDEWEEVPARGIYRLDLHAWASGSEWSDCHVCFPWTLAAADCPSGLAFHRVNRTLPEPGTMVESTVPRADSAQSPASLRELQWPPQFLEEASGLLDVLRQAVAERVQTVPPVTTDSTDGTAWRNWCTGHTAAALNRFLVPTSGPARLAILFSGGVDCLCLAALTHQILPLNEPIDLINVAFENPRTTALKQPFISTDQPARPHMCSPSTQLWAGHSTLPTADKHALEDFDDVEYCRLFDVPDRLTGRHSLAALRAWAPDRDWRFVAVNVPYSDVEKYRTRIVDLMAPAATVMDLSIATAIWFAASGRGHLEPLTKEKDQGRIQLLPYTSTARVLLLGMGADEQLGGYSKHLNRFNQEGWLGLVDEMQDQIDRIATRNLGRDDRIVSDHGKEARYPFLSHHVVRYLSGVPVHHKADLRYPRGVGEKLILRAALYRHLGLPLDVAQRWKKAIQFGARTAKMTSGRDQGTDRVQG